MSPFGSRASGLRLERIQASPRFADGMFRNTLPVGPGLRKGSVVRTMGEYFFGGGRRTPHAPLPSESPLAAWERAPETGLRATWLGHSTVLLEIDGVRVLTDPVWGDRASPVAFAGPKRFQPVPVAIDALPALDAIVISHDHYDHLDFPTVLELSKIDVPIFTSLGVGAHLEAWGIPAARITELDWWESAELAVGKGLSITAAPSQHFSGRGAAGSRNTTLWSSLALRGPSTRFSSAGTRGSPPNTSRSAPGSARSFDLVMLEVGAYHPAWGDIHLGPENALAALELLGGGSFLPVHWGTFNLAMHDWDEPAETLCRLAPAAGAHLVMPLLGEAIEPSRVDGVEPWWRPLATGDSEHPRPPDENESPLALGEPVD